MARLMAKETIDILEGNLRAVSQNSNFAKKFVIKDSCRLSRIAAYILFRFVSQSRISLYIAGEKLKAYSCLQKNI